MGDEKTPYALNELFSQQDVYDAEGNLLWDALRNTGKYEAEVYGSVTEELLPDLLKEGKYPIVRVRMYGLVPLSRYGNRVYAVRCVYPK